MVKLCPLLGTKSSYACMFISAWGIVILLLLGFFFYIQAVPLFPDLSFGEVETVSLADIEAKYNEKATQCWIAAGMYGVTLILVLWQNKYNTQSLF